MRIGIFGGTFNPPHIGHVRSADVAAQQLGLDLLIIVPAGVPPHKPLPPGTPPPDVRLSMTHTAFRNARNVIVSDMEVGSTDHSYTVKTVMAIKSDYPAAELFLLVGTDMYLSFESWKDIETILGAAVPAAFSRGFDDQERITKYSKIIHDKFGVDARTIINNVVEISSSQIRDMLPLREGSGFLADANYSFIIQNRLYGAKPEWGWLRARAYTMLEPIRIPHVAGCEDAAVRLAERWNVDRDDAREAAILHDITKKLDTDENLKILEAHGTPVESLGFGEEKLLHSKSGAVLAQTMFGVSDAVADAIRWHTTGRAHMSMLEKIIYIADYIEPTRVLPDIHTLRSLAFENIDAALIMGLEMSIDDMLERGITPDRTSYDALNYLKAQDSHPSGETPIRNCD